MPPHYFPYSPDVLLASTNLREDSSAGVWWYSLTTQQRANYFRQLQEMLDSFGSECLAGIAIRDPSRVLERCRGNMSCFASISFLFSDAVSKPILGLRQLLCHYTRPQSYFSDRDYAIISCRDLFVTSLRPDSLLLESTAQATLRSSSHA